MPAMRAWEYSNGFFWCFRWGSHHKWSCITLLPKQFTTSDLAPLTFSSKWISKQKTQKDRGPTLILQRVVQNCHFMGPAGVQEMTQQRDPKTLQLMSCLHSHWVSEHSGGLGLGRWHQLLKVTKVLSSNWLLQSWESVIRDSRMCFWYYIMYIMSKCLLLFSTALIVLMILMELCREVQHAPCICAI